MVSTPTDLTATLAGIRERAEKARTAPALSKARDLAFIYSAQDIPRLLAAVDAVLKLAASGRRIQFINGEQWWDLDPAEVRGAITRKLTGEGGNDGQ